MLIEIILVLFTFISGIVGFLGKIFYSKYRQDQSYPWWLEYARSFFPIFLFVLLFRSFIYEPFRIPSGSLEPTLQIGDFILVNKFSYGLRLPLIYTKFLPNKEPKRGDIIVFRWPPKPKVAFIKRVIGLPGDHIQYMNKQLVINGKSVPQEFIEYTFESDERGDEWPVILKEEDLSGIKHAIYQRPDVTAYNFQDFLVPKGYYFVMGDNRDDSADSRFWGFVPEENLLGRASLIWFSWDNEKYRIRWDRMGNVIH